MKPCVPSSELHKPGVVTHSGHRGTQELELGEFTVKELESSLGFLRPCLKTKENKTNGLER